MTGIVSDIQRFSLHDGPGIRTTVFLKGCNLRCFWCHNPETLRHRPELQTFPEKCIGCSACLTACRNGAHALEDGKKVFRRALCVGCGACARSCYAEGLVLIGREMTVEEAFAEVMQDRDFYQDSGGGVTVSGGEPLFQRDFTRALLERCKAEGLHTAIETNLAWPWETVAAVLPVTDLVMLDIKTLDAAKHAEGTGVSNRRILDNARRLARTDKPLIARTPVIPGFNDAPEDIRAIAAFLAEFPNLLSYELLPYHPLATGKYESLGIEYRASGLKRPPKETMRALAADAREAGIAVKTAGD
jgi:pyruvate formate lyase activating enzyme